MDAAALRASWAQVARHGDVVPGFFYAWLFTAHPHLRELFPMAMAAQRDRLVGALGRIVAGVDDLERVVPFVRGLGVDHRRFDVKPDHYPPVGKALLATLEHFLGPAWTPQLAADWTAAYETVSTAMIHAAEAAGGPAWWTATVVDHERRGLDVAVVRLHVQQPYPFRPGQACAIEVPSRPRLWRYYSIANTPRVDNTIEVHVKAVPGGQVSTAIVAGLTDADTVRLGPAVGENLRLDPESGRPVLLVAGGTGLAPLKALVEQTADDGGHRSVTMLVGARTAPDLYDLPTLTEMASRWSWLTVLPVISDEPGYLGERGTVADAVTRLGRWHDHDIYVCGPAAMVAATRTRLAAAGVVPHRIRTEDDTCDPYRPTPHVTDEQEEPTR